jgi:16S rRNA (guanine527-N7)-methyltransferase
MASKLPLLARLDFERGLSALSPEPLTPKVMEALYAHYLELVRWNERAGLIGPGTAGNLLERHYGEALAALPLIPATARCGVDIGSGAGFPGLVLAIARPALEMTLVEPKQRKWSFLVTAVRKASLSCHCLDVRVTNPLPAGIPKELDLVTVRALKLETDVLGALARRLTPEGVMLLWIGEDEPPLPPEVMPHKSLRLPGAERRRILQLRPAGSAATGGSRGRPAGSAATGGSRGRPAGSDPREVSPACDDPQGVPPACDGAMAGEACGPATGTPAGEACGPATDLRGVPHVHPGRAAATPSRSHA